MAYRTISKTFDGLYDMYENSEENPISEEQFRQKLVELIKYGFIQVGLLNDDQTKQMRENRKYLFLLVTGVPC